MKLFLKGTKCDSIRCPIERRPYPPGQHGRGRIRESEYLLQLREKQKARRIYGLLEKQFRNLYAEAARQKGITGENLLRMLELRLDNVVFRTAFAASRNQSRQFVRHGHVLVNGKRVTIPSYQVKKGDVVEMSAKAQKMIVLRHNIDTLADNITNAINQLQTATDQLATTIRQALRTRTPEPTQTPRCRDGQVGREGAIVWGDPTCQDIPTKAALCHNHYMASYRWRIREGIDTSRDFQEIA